MEISRIKNISKSSGQWAIGSLAVAFYRLWHGRLRLKGAGLVIKVLAPHCKSLQHFPLRLNEGQTINLDFRDISAVCWLNYTLGEDFEETGLIKAMSLIIDSNSVVWDVGANCGKVSYLIASHTDARKVIFFEPNKLMFEMTTSALSPFTQASGHNIALSDKTVESELTIPHGNSTTATLDPGATRRSGETIRVNCVIGDELIVNEEAPIPSIIKIDTEGHELKVIAGLAATIKAHRPVIFFEHLSLSDTQIKDIIPLGYEIFTVASIDGHLMRGFDRSLGHNSALLPTTFTTTTTTELQR